ncbi:hypothetical protein C8Q76DRAFT_795917 [Earliella scabrosa]|nr:hypothetical protein C8Q76DRAFT_795917 [Earliella scabrosa]
MATRCTPFIFLVAINMVSRRILSVAAAYAVIFSVPGHSEPIAPDVFGPSVFTAPGAFPTSLYRHYYNSPTATSVQPQPVISDPVTHKIYPFALTNPDRLPKNNTQDPHPLPPKASPGLLLEAAFGQVLSIANNPAFGTDNCARCQAALEVGKFLAMAAPGPLLGLRPPPPGFFPRFKWRPGGFFPHAQAHWGPAGLFSGRLRREDGTVRRQLEEARPAAYESEGLSAMCHSVTLALPFLGCVWQEDVKLERRRSSLGKGG